MQAAAPQSFGLRVSHSLTGFDYGMMMKNEDGDVPEALLRVLEARREAFAAAGYDLSSLRSRLNS